MTLSLTELATQISALLEGAPQDGLSIIGISTLTRAGPQEISFFTNGLYREELANTQAAAVIIAPNDQHCCKVPRLVMENPYLGYARAAALFEQTFPHLPGIHPTAYVSPEANIAPTVSIGPHVVIQADVTLGREVVIGPGCVIERGVKIGDHSHLRANITVCTGTTLGQRIIIHPGAVIGSDGFGLANDAGTWVKIPQLGGVLIEDEVEIGANTTIDKGSLGDTILRRGVKLDNQIQIGHNVQIGEHTVIAGCVGIAGSTRIGRHCMIGGGVGIVGHIEIVDKVHITGGSIILQSILEPGVYSSGTPLQPTRRWQRNYHRFKQLDELAQRIQSIEQSLNKHRP